MKSEVKFQEVRTEPLANDRIPEFVPEITRTLGSWGHTRIKVTHGFGCNLPIDRLWQAIEIATPQLAFFIERSLREGTFRYGRCDLHIEDLQETLEFKLCHESDVHFASTDPNLVEQVITLWRRDGIALFASPGPKGSALRKEWKQIGADSEA